MCVCVRGLPVPRQSRLEYGACVFVCGCYLYPGSPGWGFWGTCLRGGVGLTPPILGRICGVCVRVRVLPSPPILVGLWGVCVGVWVLQVRRQSWLGFVVCAFGCVFCLQPAIPRWGVGVCVFVCAFCLYPAIPGWDLRCLCSDAGFGFTPRILAGICGACVRVRVLLHPANPGSGSLCVCLGTGFGFTPPILAGVWDGCVWVWVLAAPRQSWLGCGLCIGVRVVPVPSPSWPELAVPWSGAGFGFTPPFVAGVSGVCVSVRVLLVTRQSWLAFVVCLLGYRFCLHPANHGWGIGVCVFVCALCLYRASPGWGVRFVCVRVRILASPRHSWLGFVVCVHRYWFGVYPGLLGCV